LEPHREIYRLVNARAVQFTDSPASSPLHQFTSSARD
jgi:hypothetical protein